MENWQFLLKLLGTKKYSSRMHTACSSLYAGSLSRGPPGIPQQKHLQRNIGPGTETRYPQGEHGTRQPDGK